jgi:formylglycine-generating enzyme required for sulfatase activity
MSFALAWLLAGPASAAVTIDWVPVGNSGNAPDSPSSNCYAASCGAVGYSYLISKYEVTNSQYAEFLNAVDAGGANALLLYNPSMNNSFGIEFLSGNPAGSKYVANAGADSKPVTYVSFYDALRFTNWLHNGQGAGDTETGAYTLLGGTPTPSNGTTVTRNGGALVFLPSENEWYKAAYFDGASYFDFPAGTDATTTCVSPTATPNTANCENAVGASGEVTIVGSYTGSPSPYGTFDQGGNVWEWNEEIVGANRGIRGGSFSGAVAALGSNYPSNDVATLQTFDVGFRVAAVPEPGTGLLVMLGVLGLGAWRRRG